MSEKEFNALIDTKINQILKAAADYQNNPDKTKEYINRTILNIAEASKEFGKMSVTEELFGKFNSCR